MYAFKSATKPLFAQKCPATKLHGLNLRKRRTQAPATQNRTQNTITITKTTPIMPTVRFYSKKKFSSSIISLGKTECPDQVNTFSDFFRYAKHRRLLFTCDSKIIEMDPTEEHRKAYRRARKFFQSTGGTVPDYHRNECKVLEVMSPGMRWPYLQLSIKNILWIDIPLNCEVPDLCFITLLDSRQIPKGSIFSVWLFNKVMGSNKDKATKRHSAYIGTSDDEVRFDLNEQEFSSPRTTAFHRVYIEHIENGEIAFSSDFSIEVCFGMPKTFLNMLPMSHKKFEYDGSKKLTKILDNDIPKSLMKIRSGFLKWSSSGSKQEISIASQVNVSNSIITKGSVSEEDGNYLETSVVSPVEDNALQSCISSQSFLVGKF